MPRTPYREFASGSLVPEDRITKAYAKAMAPMINEIPKQGSAPQSSHHTAALVVIDRWGNIAALVHSINAMPWGSTGIVVGGILIQFSWMFIIQIRVRIVRRLQDSIVLHRERRQDGCSRLDASCGWSKLLPE
jgi:hypothetical protein